MAGASSARPSTTDTRLKPVEGPERRSANGLPPRPLPRRDARQRAADWLAQLHGAAFAWKARRAASTGPRRDRNEVDHGDSDGVDERRGASGRSGGRLPLRSARRHGVSVGLLLVAGAILATAGAGLAVGRVWERRSSPHGSTAVASAPPPAGLPLIAGSPTSVASGSAAAASSTAPTSTLAALVAVHAAGAVARPGVYLLPASARVDDVLAAAGGAAADADLDAVNLAEGVVDGERVAFPRRGSPVPTITAPTRASTPGASGTASTMAVPIDLNTATPAELDSLPGVGPATAASIIEFRTRNGRFRSVAQLLDVPGIGDAKLAALRSRVRV